MTTRSRWSVLGLMLGAAVGLGVSSVGAQEAAFGQSAEDAVRPSPEAGREQVMALLVRKESDLDRREATLLAREQDLRAAEEQVGKRLSELQTLRDDIRGMLTGLDEERTARVMGLVKMFESMRAAQAAAILEKTDADIALAVLSRMNKGKAGKALAAMTPEKAAYFAERLGGPALSSAKRAAPP
jgi:flagellar motility protein MotE (MotC chaperone)